MAKYRTVKICPDKWHVNQLGFYVFLIPLAAFMLLPILYVVFQAFKPLDELFAYPPRFVTTRPTLQNFAKLFSVADSSNFPASIYLFNSIVSTAMVVVLTVLISAASGFVLSKRSFKGKNTILKVNQVALMFVPIAVAIPRFLVIKQIGLFNSFFAHVLPLLAMPVGLFLVKQFIDQLPTPLIEAAQIDGATDYGILFRIVIPLIKPALATVSILAFQASWNSVEASQMLIDVERLKTFAYYMTTVTAATGNNVAGQGMAAAATLILFVPNIILFIVMQSKVMNTVAHSGIK